jgi:hypothetical protein
MTGHMKIPAALLKFHIRIILFGGGGGRILGGNFSFPIFFYECELVANGNHKQAREKNLG